MSRPEEEFLALTQFGVVSKAIATQGCSVPGEGAAATPLPYPTRPVRRVVKMTERCYGGKKLSYVVTAKGGGGHIELFVFHENESMRRTLQSKNDNPRDLLKHYDAFLRSSIRAQYWLAKVMEDFRTHFEKNLVNFTFITFK